MSANARESFLKGATLALAATGSLALTSGATPAMAQGKGYVPMSDPFNGFSLGIGGGVDIFRTSTDGYYDDGREVFGGRLAALALSARSKWEKTFGSTA